MKTKWIQLIAGLAMFVLCISICTVTSDATVIWEDNFDGDVADDWQMNEKMNVTDGMLRYIGPSTYGHAYRNSSVNVGTWNFTLMEFDSETQYVNVMFIADIDKSTYALNDGYFVALTRYSGNIEYALYKAFDYPNVEVLANYTPEDPVTGPTIHHVTVSREPTHGQILVYINGTLRMLADGGLPSEDPFGPEPVFYFFASRDVALDNIVVDDEYHQWFNTTTNGGSLPPPIIPWEWIIIGGSVAVVVIVLVVLFVKRR
ncbi:MAG: hypothetical protein RTV41_11085 [Candidatus Thorarchaeota archaeon]